MELTSLLSESASLELVNHIVDIIEQEVEKRMLAKEKQWLMQKEVYEIYNCHSKILKEWERLGLKKRRQGTKWYYDRYEIDELLQTLKK